MNLELRKSIVLSACACAPLAGQEVAAHPRLTHVSIVGDAFVINGRPTYEGRTWQGRRIEGLLLNARLVQGIFDDLNPETAGSWAYPETGIWDPDRNTDEFVAAMPHWRDHGMLAFTLNLQGGCPRGYCAEQAWLNSAIGSDGQLRAAYMRRLERILDRADELGMVIILGLYYFGQDQHLRDEAAVITGVDEVANWLLDRGYRHVLVEINNECDLDYQHAILQPGRVHELIQRVQQRTRDGYRLLAGTSFTGGTLPTENVVRAADFILLHGNSVENPARIADMVAQTRQIAGYRPVPILFNEDDHYGFDQQNNNLVAALDQYASWGFFDPGESDYRTGYQCPPVNWDINTAGKQAFFCQISEITAASAATTARGITDGCCGSSPEPVDRAASPDAPVPMCGAGAAAFPATLLLLRLTCVTPRKKSRRRSTGRGCCGCDCGL